MTYTLIDTPVGRYFVVVAAGAVSGLFRDGQTHLPPLTSFGDRDDTDPLAQLVAKQLTEYFARDRRTFELPLRPAGTDFQRSVWQLLTEIDYGQTVTYGELAETLGRPEAARAVGAAVGRNPISIIIPCHRVLGAGGKITGYAGGIDTKQRLLALEDALTQQNYLPVR